MKAVITVAMDNAAFEAEKGGRELVRILRKLADRIESTGELEHGLMDINGNRVGELTIEE